MCAKQRLRQPASARAGFNLPPANKIQLSSLVPGNTVRSGYPIWRLSPRGGERSPVRNDAGRNALSGVKVSSPVKQTVLEWPSHYVEAKATPVGTIPMGTLGVQVHGMYRRLFQELGRSPWMNFWMNLMTSSNCPQGLRTKWPVMSRREVRGSHSSEEVG